MSVDYFEFLKRRSHPDDGSVILPDLLHYWKGANGRAETSCVVTRALRLVHSNAEPTLVSEYQQYQDATAEDKEEMDEEEMEME